MDKGIRWARCVGPWETSVWDGTDQASSDWRYGQRAPQAYGMEGARDRPRQDYGRPPATPCLLRSPTQHYKGMA